MQGHDERIDVGALRLALMWVLAAAGMLIVFLNVVYCRLRHKHGHGYSPMLFMGSVYGLSSALVAPPGYGWWCLGIVAADLWVIFVLGPIVWWLGHRRPRIRPNTP